MRFPATRMWRYFAAAVLIAFAGCLCTNSTADVGIEVRNLPARTSFICLVAEQGEEVKPMGWRIRSHVMRPEKCVVSWPGENEHSSFRRTVLWEPATRIGVVTKDRENGWQVAWFEGKKADRNGHVPLLSGGSWRADLSAADQVEKLTPEKMQRLGLEKDSDTIDPE